MSTTLLEPAGASPITGTERSPRRSPGSRSSSASRLPAPTPATRHSSATPSASSSRSPDPSPVPALGEDRSPPRSVRRRLAHSVARRRAQGGRWLEARQASWRRGSRRSARDRRWHAKLLRRRRRGVEAV